jgi:hypothetical protein
VGGHDKLPGTLVAQSRDRGDDLQGACGHLRLVRGLPLLGESLTQGLQVALGGILTGEVDKVHGTGGSAGDLTGPGDEPADGQDRQRGGTDGLDVILEGEQFEGAGGAPPTESGGFQANDRLLGEASEQEDPQMLRLRCALVVDEGQVGRAGRAIVRQMVGESAGFRRDGHRAAARVFAEKPFQVKTQVAGRRRAGQRDEAERAALVEVDREGRCEGPSGLGRPGTEPEQHQREPDHFFAFVAGAVALGE